MNEIVIPLKKKPLRTQQYNHPSFYLCLLKLLMIIPIDCDRLTLKDNPYDLKINAALKKEIF